MSTSFNESDHPRDEDGQFAPKDNPDSEASLADEYDDEEVEDPREGKRPILDDEGRETGYLVNDKGYRFVDVEANPDLFQRVVRRNMGSVIRGMSMSREEEEDLVQNISLAAMSTYGTQVIPVATLKKVARAQAHKMTGMVNLSSADQHAIGIVMQNIEERERELGRVLSEREKERIFNEVRDTWYDQRRKPSSDLMERVRAANVGSLYVGEGDEERMVEGVAPWSPTDQIASAEDGSAVEQAMHLLNAEDKAGATAMLYKVMSEQYGAKPPLEDWYDAATAKQCRRMMNSYPGGVMAAVARWENAEDADEGTVALFAPMGDMDDSAKSAVCRMLREIDKKDASPDHVMARTVWESAMANASRRS